MFFGGVKVRISGFEGAQAFARISGFARIAGLAMVSSAASCLTVLALTTTSYAQQPTASREKAPTVNAPKEAGQVSSEASAEAADGAVSTTTPSGNAVRSPLPQLKPKSFGIRDIQLNVFSWGYGPSVQNPTGNSVAINGQDTRDAGNWVQLNLTAPAFGDWRLSVIPGFISIPNRQEDPVQLMNPTVGLQGVAYKTDSFTYFTRGEVALPASEGSINDGLQLGPQLLTVLNYRPVGSNFSVQQVILPGVSFFNNGDTSAFLYLSPMVSYHVSETLQLAVLSEHFLGRRRGEPLSVFGRTDPDFLGFGFRKIFNFTSTQNLFIHPYINVYPGRLALDNTHIALLFGGRFF